MLGIITFAGLFFYAGGGVDGLVIAFLGFIPAVVIVTILTIGVASIGTDFYKSFLKPFWKWIVK